MGKGDSDRQDKQTYVDPEPQSTSPGAGPGAGPGASSLADLIYAISHLAGPRSHSKKLDSQNSNPALQESRALYDLNHLRHLPDLGERDGQNSGSWSRPRRSWVVTPI